MRLKNIGVAQHVSDQGEEGPIQIIFVMDNGKTPGILLGRGSEALDLAKTLKDLADLLVDLDQEAGRASRDVLH